MRKTIIKFLQGILIGISMLIPGFSGGTMLVILGIYEEFTTSLSKMATNFITSVNALWAYGLGILLGVITATFSIAVCLERFPIISASFFVGLVLSIIPLTIKKINKRKLNLWAYLIFIICFLLSLMLPILSRMNLIDISLDNPNIFIMILIVIVTALAAATMIIPAASGAMILLTFGIYDYLIVLLQEDLDFIKNGNWESVVPTLKIFIPFIIGAILGIIVISKVLTKLFVKHDLYIWSGILGLLVSSIFTIYYNAYYMYSSSNVNNKINNNVILCIVSLLAGYMLLNLMMKLVKAKSNYNNL
jgi:putative membrane protein